MVPFLMFFICAQSNLDQVMYQLTVLLGLTRFNSENSFDFLLVNMKNDLRLTNAGNWETMTELFLSNSCFLRGVLFYYSRLQLEHLLHSPSS